jgi:hypothetical protein
VVFFNLHQRLLKENILLLLQRKGECISKFLNFKAFAKMKIRKKLKSLKKDNGKKIVSKEFDNYLKIHGIQHQKFAPYSP